MFLKTSPTETSLFKRKPYIELQYNNAVEIILKKCICNIRKYLTFSCFFCLFFGFFFVTDFANRMCEITIHYIVETTTVPGLIATRPVYRMVET